MNDFYDYYGSMERARKAEQVNDWAGAAKAWRAAGSVENAAACQMIADAIIRGNDFRARVLAHAGPEPEVSGPREDSIKWMAWFKKMNEVEYR